MSQNRDLLLGTEYTEYTVRKGRMYWLRRAPESWLHNSTWTLHQVHRGIAKGYSSALIASPHMGQSSVFSNQSRSLPAKLLVKYLGDWRHGEPSQSGKFLSIYHQTVLSHMPKGLWHQTAACRLMTFVPFDKLMVILPKCVLQSAGHCCHNRCVVQS